MSEIDNSDGTVMCGDCDWVWMNINHSKTINYEQWDYCPCCSEEITKP